MARTMRLTLPAVDESGEVEGAIRSGLSWVDELASRNDIRWFCLPLNFVADGPRHERLTSALDAVSRFPRMFLNMILAEEGRIAIEAVDDAADLVLKVARKSNNGFDNFRVGASFNCPPNTPFFPFSRHEGSSIAFSFALETTSLALEITRNRGSDIAALRDQLTEALAGVLRRIHAVGVELETQIGVEYRGLDASLAPFPDGDMSVALLIEQILGSPPGSSGAVFVTSLLTDALRSAIIESGAKAVGFNGVMFSLLEDNHLARANNRRALTMDSLVALAAVCGCGVDMVPIPGASFREEVAALMLDIAGLSSTLKKPLGVRVLPIPNRSTNEFTQFNLDFLCDSRVMSLHSGDHSFGTQKRLLEYRAPIR